MAVRQALAWKVTAMNAEELRRELKLLGACKEGLEWSRGKSLAEAWATCERADWMLWLLAQKLGTPGWPDHKQLVLLACRCAETSLSLVPPGEGQPRKAISKAIEAARAWTEGRASLAEVQEAAACAVASVVYDDVATCAADSAAGAADSVANVKNAGNAAIYAAKAAARAGHPLLAALREMADMIRSVVPSVRDNKEREEKRHAGIRKNVSTPVSRGARQ